MGELKTCACGEPTYSDECALCKADKEMFPPAYDDRGIAVQSFAIEVEKMLCEAIGRPWSAVGISIETLIAELKNRAAAAHPQQEPVLWHVTYGDGDVEQCDTERKARVAAKELVENGWLNVRIRPLVYAIYEPAQVSQGTGGKS